MRMRAKYAEKALITIREYQFYCPPNNDMRNALTKIEVPGKCRATIENELPGLKQAISHAQLR